MAQFKYPVYKYEYKYKYYRPTISDVNKIEQDSWKLVIVVIHT